jgi:spore coat polysaccharide biosynthesis protein SpsF (cytidylyltransferase family)/sialic acid synthase SpsE
MNTYQIIELANTHGGDIAYLKELIIAFEKYKGDIGMKFQPLSADTLSTPEYEWYNVYKELEFSKEEWKETLQLASRTKDIWLDLFDLYGVEILADNLNIIYGIKFQSSVLYNYEVFDALKMYDLSNKKIILNVAARPINEIRSIIDFVTTELNPEEIMLEFGFQGYPTKIEDAGLSKIKILKENFSNKLVFADHVDANSPEAITLPVKAILSGVDVIEKHVMLDKPTKYDTFSSLTPTKYNQMVENILETEKLLQQPFINEREIIYLNNSIMVPVLKHDKKRGQGIDIKNDLTFRRNKQKGLNIIDIQQRLNNFELLNRDKIAGDALNREDFTKANIAVIIACRLKSSRLKKKALLNIGDKTSVELCISNALKFRNVNHVILATSDNEEDRELEKYTYSPAVIFHTGDPDDVMKRYLSICEKLKIDTVVRITADMPFIDDEVCQILLNEHFLSGADYTTAKETSVGVNMEILNVNALQRIKAYFKSADYSEYMTWYFQNNPEFFKLNFVNLPVELVRNYRLTLDYQEDLDMFNQIVQSINIEDYTIKDIFKFLDENPEVSKMNSHLTLRYKTDADLIKTLDEKTKMN